MQGLTPEQIAVQRKAAAAVSPQSRLSLRQRLRLSGSEPVLEYCAPKFIAAGPAMLGQTARSQRRRG